MNTKIIDFMNNNYKKRTKELMKDLTSTNITLETFIEDLNNETTTLQRNKEFDKISNIIQAQKVIYELMENNSKILDNMDNDKEDLVETTFDTINYEEYSVDNTKAYDLSTNFRHKRPHAISIKNDYISVTTWREMLIKTAEYLYNLNPKTFKSFPNDTTMSWGNKFNFSKDINQLRSPALVANSGIFVETAKDSIAVRQLVIKMLEKFDIDISDYKVYLRADYTPLHVDNKQLVATNN